MSGQLDAVRAAARAALDDLGGRLRPGMSQAELRATVAVIEQVIAGLIRPASHDLAGMPAGPDTGGPRPQQGRTRQRQWAQQRRLAAALHGRVQASLTAAAVLLSAAADAMAAGVPLDPDLVARVRQSLALAGRLDQAPPSPPRQRLAAIAGVWAGVAEVEVELRPAAEEALASDRDAADACAEVLRELLLNAVRHGGATTAQVLVGLDPGPTVRLQVAEHRPGPPPPAGSGTPGLGRSLIDALALDWAVREAADGRTTVVWLAVDARMTR